MERKKVHLDKWVSEHKVLKGLTSHVIISFFYGIFLFLYEIKFLRELIPVIHPILIAWAGGLILYDLLIRDYWKKIPYFKLLFIFLIFTGITALVNYETGILSNIKGCILMALPLLVFYPVCVSEKNAKENIVKSLIGAASVIFVASLIAIGMYIFRISEEITIMGITDMIGYRYYIPSDPKSGLILYGIYTDTNHAAIYSVVFAIYSIIVFCMGKKEVFHTKLINYIACVCSVVNFIIQIIYFPLANSRGGWLCVGCAMFTVIFLYCLSNRKTVKNQVLKIVVAILVSIISTVCVYGILIGLRTVTSDISIKVSSMVEETNSASAIDIKDVGSSSEVHKIETANDGTQKEMENSDISEELVENTDTVEDSFAKQDGEQIGGGRIEIWKGALDIFKNNFVLGIGVGNSQYYALKYNMAESRLARGTEIHNSYLDLLVDYGCVGFILLMSFFIVCAKKIVCFLFDKNYQKDGIYFMMLYSLIVVAGASVFLSCVFINTTAMYYLMLILLGYLLCDI